MTDESLEKYIEMYNSEKWDRPISSYQISGNVDVALIWDQFPTGKVSNEESNRFFFIKNDEKCIAIVFDMGVDLHWYVLEHHRKLGYLHNALKNTIFPYIFLGGLKEQKATAESKQNIAYLLKQGFEEREKDKGIEYFLCAKKVKDYDKSQLIRSPLTNKDIQDIRHEVDKLAGELNTIKDRLEYTYGSIHELEQFIFDLKNFGSDFKYFLTAEKGKSFNKYQSIRNPLTDREIQGIRRKFNKLAGDLRVIRDLLECTYGDNYGLENFASNLKSFGLDLKFHFESSK